MTLVKICGIRSIEEAYAAARAGAWAIGEVFSPSPRQVSREQAVAINQKLGRRLLKVGVFVDEALESVNQTVEFCGLDLVQLHGRETPDYVRQVKVPVIKAFRIREGLPLPRVAEWDVYAFLFDTYDPRRQGGSGRTFNWDLVAGFPGPSIIAGGLTSENVAEAIRRLKPLAVDVSSGVEKPAGGKDPDEITEFIRRVKEANANAFE